LYSKLKSFRKTHSSRKSYSSTVLSRGGFGNFHYTRAIRLSFSTKLCQELRVVISLKETMKRRTRKKEFSLPNLERALPSRQEVYVDETVLEYVTNVTRESNSNEKMGGYPFSKLEAGSKLVTSFTFVSVSCCSSSSSVLLLPTLDPNFVNHHRRRHQHHCRCRHHHQLLRNLHF